MRSAFVAAHALGGVALAAVLTAPPIAAYAATTQFVPCTGTNGGAAGLAAAVAIANADGSGLIKLAPKCTYIFNTSADGDNALPIIGGNITISGSESTITRNPNALPFRIAFISAGSLTLIGVTASGGSSPFSGGGFFLSGGQLILKFSKVTGNRSEGVGGAITSFPGSMVQLNNSLASDNHADGSGGAIFNGGGTIRAFDSTFTKNTSIQGGAIHNDGVTKLIHSTVIGNKAASGGGISNLEPGIVQLNKSAIADNHSTNNGGGIRNTGQVQITDSLITRNVADVSALGTGGGIFNDGSVNLLRSAVIRNYPNNCAGSVQVPGCMN